MHTHTHLLGVPDGTVVGERHELVDEVGLVHVAGQGAQLLVGRQVPSTAATRVCVHVCVCVRERERGREGAREREREREREI